MFLNIDNPVYNTIIVFSVIMILLYITKPDVVYDHEKHQFRQFGTTNGKTLLPIYVIGILMAVILYVFFYHLSLRNIDNTNNTNNTKKKKSFYNVTSEPDDDRIHQENVYQYQIQQIQQQAHQIQQLQNQINQMNQMNQMNQIQQQLNQQLQQQNQNNKNNELPISLNV